MTSLLANSANLEPTVNKLCNKMKECLVPELEASDIPQSLFDQMIQQVDMQCQAMFNWSEVEVASDLEKAAVACLDSLVEQTCEELMSEQQTLTTACQAYEDMQK